MSKQNNPDLNKRLRNLEQRVETLEWIEKTQLRAGFPQTDQVSSNLYGL